MISVQFLAQSSFRNKSSARNPERASPPFLPAQLANYTYSIHIKKHPYGYVTGLDHAEGLEPNNLTWGTWIGPRLPGHQRASSAIATLFPPRARGVGEGLSFRVAAPENLGSAKKPGGPRFQIFRDDHLKG